jgi:hypothetical protein
MMSDRTVTSRKPRRRLSPSEKYGLWVLVLTGQATRRSTSRCGVAAGMIKSKHTSRTGNAEPEGNLRLPVSQKSASRRRGER